MKSHYDLQNHKLSTTHEFIHTNEKFTLREIESCSGDKVSSVAGIPSIGFASDFPLFLDRFCVDHSFDNIGKPQSFVGSEES